jgi:methionyl-tRNA synthetase
VWSAQPGITQVSEVTEIAGEGSGPDYPVLTGDYAAQQARWASIPIEAGRPLAKPTPLFTKLDPGLAESGPEWAPIQS